MARTCVLLYATEGGIVPTAPSILPVALTDEVHVLLLEPEGTLNTGVTSNRTLADLDGI